MNPFQYQKYQFKRPSGLNSEDSKVYDVVVVGAGPVGLTMALSLAKQGIEVVLLTDNDQVSIGSRAICFSKRTLEIFDKLDVAVPMMAKGVQWNAGRIFFRDKEIDHFDLSPERLSKYPAFINLQQYYVEQFLIDAVLKEEKADIRWRNKVVDIKYDDGYKKSEVVLRQAQDQKSKAALRQAQGQMSNFGMGNKNEKTENPNSNSDVGVLIETPEGNYSLQTKYLIACDGSRSTIRNLLNLTMKGERFEERFLIADFFMEADFPSERWFWFDPPFARGQSILLHKQPDNLWRLDFKLGKHVDNSIAGDKNFIAEKIRTVIGERPFELDWTSIYSFSSKMLERFVHDRIIFAGDAAHVVSPFGARGANSGIQDADNLSWKLAAILKGNASEQFLETYNIERTNAARQNIATTSQATLFIAPPTLAATTFRNSILEKAATDTAYKRQINCGRLSTASIYGKYPNSEEGDPIAIGWNNSNIETGHCIKDCFLENRKEYLVEKLPNQFTLLTFAETVSNTDINTLESFHINCLTMNPTENTDLIKTYDITPGAAYLITPDQYILGRWKNFSTHKAIDLITAYMSGVIYEQGNLQKTEQDLIDEQVAEQIARLVD